MDEYAALMSTFEDAALKDIGWELYVDEEAEELHIEHAESGDSYVFDADGNLRVSGNEVDASEIRKLRETLSSALSVDSGEDGLLENILESDTCRIECDDAGTLSIEADRKISVEAPQLELSGKSNVDISANGSATIDASGILTLNGSVIKLN